MTRQEIENKLFQGEELRCEYRYDKDFCFIGFTKITKKQFDFISSEYKDKLNHKIENKIFMTDTYKIKDEFLKQK